MAQSFQALLTRALSLLDKVQWLGPLLVRIALASVFIFTGWGKLHGLEKVTGYFTQLGIPLPGLNAAMVATVEFVGGCLLLVGLFTRLAAVPMAFSMLVAIATGRRGDIDGIPWFFGFDEFVYVSCFVWLILAGAGAVSVDHFLRNRWFKSVGSQPAPTPANR
jgi:putative oxidoreductase